MLSATLFSIIFLLACPELVLFLVIEFVVQILVEIAERRPLFNLSHADTFRLLLMLALLRLLLLHLLLFFWLMLSLMLLLLLLLALLLLMGLLMLVLMLQQGRTFLGLGGGPRDSNTTPTPAAAGARQAARPRAPHLGTLAHSMSKHPGEPVAPDICSVPSLNTDNVRDA
jgi:hypothetical protein